MTSNLPHGPQPIAIVGSACRFPGEATTPTKLWELLEKPRDVLKEIPRTRFDVDRFYHPDGTHHGTSNVRHSYILSEDHRLFDAQFFGTKPVEANSIDPQQRLLLETVYESLEFAGIPTERLQGSDTGVYVGLMTNDYADLLGRDIQDFPTYFASGTARSILSNRVSYFFDWHGPSMTIDTACSSSLIAVHQAVQSLRNGECGVAVAAGTNLLLGPEQYVAESKLKMLSPSGRSKMWDKDADGYARGDGIAAVVLKPLTAALEDGDHIECIIRETGINQDGRTKGITMPNPMAQAELIRSTYKRAGLDLSRPSDRPQYFEAHGTGTPAGDPVEAEAISKAFFGNDPGYWRDRRCEPPLFVGSIKTIVGHTEGTAGLAAILKASLALQNSKIPPNLLLNELSPSVLPFYDDLKITDASQEWPALRNSDIRRVSVNSFGFGGANAHAILESYGSNLARREDRVTNPVLLPFNFSANSVKSLVASLDAFVQYLKERDSVDLRSLSWTLNCRRSTLPTRLSIAAANIGDLREKLENLVKTPPESLSLQHLNIKQPKILGIFTGQGAQWAGMGAELLNTGGPLALKCISELDKALQSIREQDRPTWSLRDEIMKDRESSRINEALFSQTICTAIQVLLVDLVHAAGIQFDAVVGHSSGEIAAAYAAGYLSAKEAIIIAYYRGWSLQHSPRIKNVNGSMMVAGTSLDDANELCDMPSLKGRVCVAASNSTLSTTLSGDEDAIEEVMDIFEDEGKFNRRLKVDKAYHSHHMLPCAVPYVERLRDSLSRYNRTTSNSKTTWISSVYGADIKSVNDSIADTYWSNNMIKPVLFSQAVSFASSARGPFDMAIEVGPHPALKGPTLQTILEVSGQEIPYSGTLTRGSSAALAFASMLGAVWLALGSDVVKYEQFDSRIRSGSCPPSLLKDLPTYQWDHERIYWHESRTSIEFRGGGKKFHPLLGTQCPDGTTKEIRWRNYFHPREIPWLVHHQVQGQVVFPAAGYVSAATEIIAEEYGVQSTQLIDFQDIVIGQALTLEENSGTEITFAFNNLNTANGKVMASFNCYSSTNTKGTPSILLHASAQVTITLGKSQHDILPFEQRDSSTFLEIEAERFYSHVSKIGFGYTGPFLALSDLRRKMDEAAGVIGIPSSDDNNSPLILHPASLDGAIQSIMLAYSFPGDGRFRSLHLPTRIDRIRINLAACSEMAIPESNLKFFSSVTNGEFNELSGDVDICSSNGQHTILQLEGLHTTPLVPMSAAMDIPMFTEFTWAPELPSARDLTSPPQLNPGRIESSLILERILLIYLNWACSIFESNTASVQNSSLLSYARNCVRRVRSGDHPFAPPAWLDDNRDDIEDLIKGYESSEIDLQIIQRLGQIIPLIISGDVDSLNLVTADGLFDEFFKETFGIQFYVQELAKVVGQISNRFPHMHILEIGADTGELTRPVLSALGTAFASYTFTTDSTSDSFGRFEEAFEENQAKMAFRALSIETEISPQGYDDQSYDLVIASLTLSATGDPEASLLNIRRLLKPGGYVVLLDITDPDVMRFGLVLGSLSRPSSANNYNRSSPSFLSIDKWQNLLTKTGFSDLDISLHNDSPRSVAMPFSLMLVQAVDERIKFLRDPLDSTGFSFPAENLTIIGGDSERNAILIEGIKNHVAPYFGHVYVCKSLADLSLSLLPAMGTVLSLTELDGPTFASMTPETLTAFQGLFKESKNIIWIGQGAQGSNPFSNMFVGIQRTLVTEMDHLRVQFLNVESLTDLDGMDLARKVLQFIGIDQWDQMMRDNQLLWYREPELRLKDGRYFIPRLKLSKERNDRYNSSRKLVLKSIDRTDATAEILPKDVGYQVVECGPNPSPLPAEVTVRVTNALLRAVMISPQNHLFLLTGMDDMTGENVIAFSDSLKSSLNLHPSCIMRSGLSEEETTHLMLKIYIHLLVLSALCRVPPGKSLALLDPDFSLLAAFKHHAMERGVQLVLISSSQSPSPSPWIHIHPHSKQSSLMTKLPHDIAYFYDARSDRETPAVALQALPRCCQIDDENSLTAKLPAQFSKANIDDVAMIFQRSWVAGSDPDIVPVNVNRTPICEPISISKGHIKSGRQTMISLSSASLPVQVFPASKIVQFSKNKTYWLVGLTGGLGMSLCQWMTRQGARYIALSSRNPRMDTSWIDKMASRGCTVRTFTTDITDRESVHKSYQDIQISMPPIAGVAQGAMVLEDTMFFDLDLPRFEKVLRPKVQGTLLLDELFDKDTLDFMILFSSMASITGNPGQVAYNAANMFMSSLAAQRRDRGLATHAINLGAIVGNGYVTRELNIDQQSYLYRTGHTWMSEQDFHEVFAEGIWSCLQRERQSDPCSALRIDDDHSKKWYSNPIFQHLVFTSDVPVAGDDKRKSGMTLKARLLHSSSHVDVMNILQDGFTIKMHSALQTDLGRSMIEMSPDELGIDSLIAVDIRSWFLKELGLDVPVLRIFNAKTLRELLEFAISILPQSAIPNLDPQEQNKAQTDRIDLETSSKNLLGEESEAETKEEDESAEKNFNIHYPSVTETESVSSSPSVLSGDSVSEQNGGSSSSSSIENDIEMSSVEEVQKIVSMSMAQTGFWFLRDFVQRKTAFNVTPTFELTGKIDIQTFSRAVGIVAQHHEAMRTFFFVGSDQRPMQGVWKYSRLNLEHIKIAEESDAGVAAQEMADHIFNLEDGEAIRIKILSLGDDRHWIIFGFHHIIMDGISFEILWSDLETAYNGRPLAPVLQYPDYAVEQNEDYEKGALKQESLYWKSQFHEIPDPIPLLPFSLRPDRPEIVGFSSHMVQIKLESAFSEEIEKCCRRFKVTPFHFHLATWQVFLLRHLGIEKICIGLGDGNRTHPDVMQTVGLFLNTLPLQFDNNPSQTFGEIIKYTKNVSQTAFANARMPFDAILHELKVPRSASHNPLFQAFFNFRQNVDVSREFCGCKAQASLIGSGDTSYDLQLDVSGTGNGETSVYMLVQKDLYSLEHAELLLGGYERMLREFCRNPATRVSWPEIYSNDDIERSLSIGRGHELQEPWSLTVINRLDDMISKYVDSIALKEVSGKQLTYSMFNERIHAISRRLLNCGVYPSARVGVFMSPGADWICSLFAILRVGATYIPLDMKLGLSRLAVIISDSRPMSIIIDSTTAMDLPSLNADAQSIDLVNPPDIKGIPVPNMASQSETAIIMYTSGSTGIPKGISISHAAYIQHVQAFSAAWKIQEATETILHQSSYAWDMSIYQILMAICNGQTLVIADSSARGDPVAISRLISSMGITTTFATPTEYLTWLRNGREYLQSSQMKMAISGGEFISSSLVNEFRSLNKEDLKFVNVYGPAETTLACSSAEVFYQEDSFSSKNPQLGLHPLPNYSIYVVDSNLNPLPLGVPGEVVVGGLGIAQGYLSSNQTRESFFSDSYASLHFQNNGWNVVHRTGDRGKLTKSNGLVLLGRIADDNQIKLGGIRVNVEEVEMTLLNVSKGLISQAVVSARTSESISSDSQVFLVAFVVMKDATSDPTHFLQTLIEDIPLPSFMRPAALIPVESLPENASGKVDRLQVNKIPLPEINSKPVTREAPVSLENLLKKLWKDVIPRELSALYSINSDSDFFHVGGSSLSLVTLQSLIQEHLSISVPIYQLFESSTLRGMANRLEKLSSEVPNLSIDWNSEIDELVAAVSARGHFEVDHRVTSLSGPSVVVLTGATGFIGREILRQLVKSETVHSIYCIAVRKPKDKLPSIFRDPKVHIYNGDLGSPRLGLTSDDAKTIFSHADIIIHNGADVSFMKTYQSLKLINITSTEELVKLSLPRRIPFHYVSSASVTRLASQESFGETSVSRFPPPNLEYDGYTAMKWVSEVFLERMSHMFHLSICIHRPSSVTGSGAPDLDIMRNLMEYCEKIGMIPDLSSWSGTFDMISVESVGSQILKAALSPCQSTEFETPAQVKYVHECGEIQLSPAEVKPFLELSTGKKVEILPLGDWVQHAERAGMSTLVGLYLRKSSSGQFMLPTLVNGEA